MSNSIPTSQLNYVKKHLLEPRKFGRRGQRSAGENVPGEKSGGKELFVLFYTLYTLMLICSFGPFYYEVRASESPNEEIVFVFPIEPNWRISNRF